MNTLKRILAILLACVMLTAALCGCKGGKSCKDAKNEITVGIAQDLDDSLDPHKMTAAGTREILFNVFEGLVKPDENGNLRIELKQPLAKSYPAGMPIRFHAYYPHSMYDLVAGWVPAGEGIDHIVRLYSEGHEPGGTGGKARKFWTGARYFRPYVWFGNWNRKPKPGAKLLVHPECTPAVTALADYIGSTTGIIDYAAKSPDKEFIIGTELSVVWHLSYRFPDKKFYPLTKNLVCRNMRLTSLPDVLAAINGTGGEEIVLDEATLRDAKVCIDKMMELA